MTVADFVIGSAIILAIVALVNARARSIEAWAVLILALGVFLIEHPLRG